CSKTQWSSKKVAIRITGYARNGYNAVIFNQYCASCNHLGTLQLDKDSYIDRVTYRLKRWAGVLTEQQHYVRKKTGLPHRSGLCEGCKRDYCQR
ncbi:zinc-binding domain-containing protein, partial [Diaporthe sp. PMI_573]